MEPRENVHSLAVFMLKGKESERKQVNESKKHRGHSMQCITLSYTMKLFACDMIKYPKRNCDVKR